ncbi:MAG: HIT family protein [Candidatus Aenigmarchaeota archaeon]|nr:HIT family protein [Candidatus Aenigmarchaeota archaeon]
MNGCLFCKIVKGEIPSKKVYEDSNTLAFLDINPANPGHTLVMPKKHAENIFDVEEDSLKSTISIVKEMAAAVKEKMNAAGVNVVQNNGKYAGQLVNHVHFHVIPRFENDNVIISYKRVQLTEKELDDVAKKLLQKQPAKRVDDWDLSGL